MFRALQCFRSTGAVLVAAGLTTVLQIRKVHMESIRKINVANFMAQPITPIETLENSNDIRVRMELMIMKIQHDFVRALEGEENFGKKFKVDRWERKEGRMKKLFCLN